MKPCQSKDNKLNIYVAHTKELDYKKDLYEPLRDSELNNLFNIVLPHEHSEEPFDSYTFLEDCTFVIAEVTHKSTSLGIELGWANAFGLTIILVHKAGIAPSKSLKAVSDTFIEYTDTEDLIKHLQGELQVVPG